MWTNLLYILIMLSVAFGLPWFMIWSVNQRDSKAGKALIAKREEEHLLKLAAKDMSDADLEWLVSTHEIVGLIAPYYLSDEHKRRKAAAEREAERVRAAAELELWEKSLFGRANKVRMMVHPPCPFPQAEGNKVKTALGSASAFTSAARTRLVDGIEMRRW